MMPETMTPDDATTAKAIAFRILDASAGMPPAQRLAGMALAAGGLIAAIAEQANGVTTVELAAGSHAKMTRAFALEALLGATEGEAVQ